jgi:hypothetical protein
MSTPSLLLSCAGAAASLAGVWSLAGLSERSALRPSPRALVATGVGAAAEAAAYFSAPRALRVELALPLLFATAGVLAFGVGAAKIDAALELKDGAQVVRRASGVVAGSFFSMAAVGAASLDLGQGSLLHARLGWALMFSLVASALVVFLQRTRYAGAGLLKLGHRAWLLGFIVVALLVGAGLTRSTTVRGEAPAPSASPVAPARPAIAEPPVAEPEPSVVAPAVSPSVALAPAPSGPSQVAIDSVTARGMLEADVLGGVTRRIDRLSACLADGHDAPSGTLVVKVGIDTAGSVSDTRRIGGELASSPAAECLVTAFYKMGFAAPSSGSAGFDITLRVSAP